MVWLEEGGNVLLGPEFKFVPSGWVRNRRLKGFWVDVGERIY